MNKQLNINKMKNLNCKTLRKVAFTMLMLLTLSLNAQNKEITRFLGIPIDGSKSEMISKLKGKGFVYDSKNDCLTGEFNGSDVNVYIGTNKNKVYRIFVADSKTFSEAQIKIKFNNLVYQFEHNMKYTSSDSSQYINENENISYQMMVNKKFFDAEFYQKSDDLDLYISNIDNADFETMHEQFHNSVIELCALFENNYYEEHYLTETKDKNEFEIFEYDKNLLKTAAITYEIMQQYNRKVWFRIFEHYGEYYIGIFYDNMNNASNGEDL